MPLRKLASFVTAAIWVFAPAAGASVLPAGTDLEVRLSVATGSRISHPGDRVEAKIISPAFQQNELILPQGATVSGVIESVDRLGFGIKHRTATMEYRFDSVRLADGRAFPVRTRVVDVETAKERVNGSGVIGGIYPTANLSSGAAFFVSALVADPALAAPVLAIKFLIARSPDPEIYFPAGTELVLRITNDAELPNFRCSTNAIAPLTPDEVAHVRSVLEALPQQQTERGPNQPSDLLNVLLLGTHDQIERAFRAAGWVGEQRHSVLALYRMYHCMVQRYGYGMAPMTRLTLGGVAPGLAYQKSLNTLSKRHHIRLWDHNGTDAWLGAGIEDVGYTVRRMHVTHATDPDIDNERAKVVNDLWLTGCVDAGSLIARDSLRPVDEHGISIATDGAVAALRLNDCRNDQVAPLELAAAPPSSRTRFLEVLSAVGTDIARSNPVALGYNAIRSLATASSPKGEQSGFLPNSPEKAVKTSETLAGYRWKRPSVIDASVDNGQQQALKAEAKAAKPEQSGSLQ